MSQEEVADMLVGFVAGRFRGDSHWAVQCNVHRARIVGLEVAQMGVMPLIPHSNSCYYFGTLPETFWLRGYQQLIHRSDLVMVVPGWEGSSGTQAEIDCARAADKPVFFTLAALWSYLKARAVRAGVEAPSDLRSEAYWLQRDSWLQETLFGL